jgi:hypothetical protein
MSDRYSGKRRLARRERRRRIFPSKPRRSHGGDVEEMPNARRQRLWDRFAGLLVSKRIIALAIGAAVSLFAERFGLPQDAADQIRNVLIAWAAGDAIRPTDNPFYSRRFWMMLFAAASAFLAGKGILIPPEVMDSIIWPIIAAIIGDAARETMTLTQKVSLQKPK